MNLLKLLTRRTESKKAEGVVLYREIVRRDDHSEADAEELADLLPTLGFTNADVALDAVAVTEHARLKTQLGETAAAEDVFAQVERELDDLIAERRKFLDEINERIRDVRARKENEVHNRNVKEDVAVRIAAIEWHRPHLFDSPPQTKPFTEMPLSVTPALTEAVILHAKGLTEAPPPPTTERFVSQRESQDAAVLKTFNERERETIAVEEDKQAWAKMSREERNRTYGFDHFLATRKGQRELAAVDADRKAWQGMSADERKNYHDSVDEYLANRKLWRERNLAS